MRVRLWGNYLEDIEGILKARGVVVADENPDLVITHGGDGALLGAEARWPGVPKFPIRDGRTADLCPCHSHESQIDALVGGRLREARLPKIRASSNNKTFLAVNDVCIHNSNRVSAVRYSVFIDGELYAEDVVGDGLVVSTVHGSTAYYRSITHSTFRVGLGLAFSNSTEVTNHIVIPETSTIRVRITRGPAMLVADNRPDCIDLGEGDVAEMSRSDETAVVLGLENFMCPECRKLRHVLRRGDKR